MKKLLFAVLFSVCALFGDEVLLQTTKGDITLKLFKDVAPKAVENFETHVKNGYYDGLIFHRVIKGFMAQGGDPTGTGMGGKSIWDKSFEDEFKPNVVFDRAGLLAMANSGANTNASQFFITFKPTPWLNGHHTIFGEVVSGIATLNEIENTPTDARDRPKDEVKIIKATLIK
ncbi:peptidylprolyl isomerase [Campylobacter geochelonis]|uniref:peptidylprolyl isomerase n=1 Tax=Campylobacter geochelonis TaxID=1780362 RepID=UPI000770AA99|nr:peptidylprolyl isomerase [Campylobacter geochelonis]CZE49996.1 peptidyl-prolyl cis-trans isomerase B (PPIase B)(rotamase B) [Campylobacter geochelonis]